jgi:hypothetical protein
MQQFYSLLLSSIPGCFTGHHFFCFTLRQLLVRGIFFEIGNRTSILIAVFAATFLINISCTLAQDGREEEQQSTARLAGSWILDDARVMIGQQKVSYITKEESFWADHINDKIPLVITANGNVTYSMDWKPAYAEIKINKDELIFIFNGEPAIKNEGAGEAGIGKFGNVSNFTSYNFTVHDGQLVLSRSDPRIAEKYIFIRQ